MPPETTPGYPVPPPAASHRSWPRTTLILAIIIILVVLAYGAYLYWQSSGSQSSRFTFNTAVNSGWYTLSGDQVVSVKGPSGYDHAKYAVLEVGTKMPSGTPALVKIPNKAGVAYGIINAQGNFVSLITGGTDKMDLSSAPDGQVVFSYQPLTQIDASSSPVWNIEYLNTSTGTTSAKDIGPGLDGRFAANNTVIVAVDSTGVIRANPDGGRLTIVNRPNLIPGAFAINANATQVVLANSASNKADVFSISPEATNASYLGSIPASLYPLTFVSNYMLVGETNGKNSGVVYDLSSTPFKQSQAITFPQ